MKYLFTPGYGKSGTTLLHHCLSQTKNFSVPTRKKEIAYFRSPNATFEGWQSEFTERNDSTEVLFEASPQYLTGATRSQQRTYVNRILATVPGAKFVVNLRNPIERAYSHYVHNLSVHFARYGAGNFRSRPGRQMVEKPYDLSFEDAIAIDRHAQGDLLSGLKVLVDAAGVDRVKLYFIERDGKDYGRFHQQLCDWLGVANDHTFSPGDAPRVYESSGAPVILYGGEDGGRVKGVEIPPRVMAITNGGTPPEVVTNVTADEADTVFSAAAGWTMRISAEEFADIYAREFKRDTEDLMAYIWEHFHDEKDVPDYSAPVFKGKHIPEGELDVALVQAQIEEKARADHSVTAAGSRTDGRASVAIAAPAGTQEPAHADGKSTPSQVQRLVDLEKQVADLDRVLAERSATLAKLVELLAPGFTRKSYSAAEIGEDCTLHPTVRIFAGNPDDEGRSVVLGDRVRMYADCEITGPARLGNRTFVNRSVLIRPHTYIGKRVSIGPYARFLTGTHEIGSEWKRAGANKYVPIHVGDGCWIGANSTILPGVTIGKGAIVAAGAVVTGDVPENTVVAGVPARVIRQLGSAQER